MTLHEYCVTFMSKQFYVWARTPDIAYAMAQEKFSDEVDIDPTGDTAWIFDDYVGDEYD